MRYDEPADFQLTVESKGYVELEYEFRANDDGALPTELTLVMTRIERAPETPITVVRGVVTRDGAPVGDAVVLLGHNAGDPPVEGLEIDTVRRGAIVPWRGFPLAHCVTAVDGSFTIRMPHQARKSLFVTVVEQPGRHVTIGAFELASADDPPRSFEIGGACGAITGRMKDFRAKVAGRFYAILFDDAMLLTERRIGHEGTFKFENLTAGRYGIVIGSEDRPPLVGRRFEGGRWVKDTDPWRNAVVVELSRGEVRDILL